ncbi:MAG: hypothetical protein EBR82_75865 [Caulobacteraceae bacterium]|nr:hypothetical protein [Caulobacteraceae bacterium]
MCHIELRDEVVADEVQKAMVSPPASENAGIAFTESGRPSKLVVVLAPIPYMSGVNPKTRTVPAVPALMLMFDTDRTAWSPDCNRDAHP